jgi:type II secretory pathway pseudopilin PulG
MSEGKTIEVKLGHFIATVGVLVSILAVGIGGVWTVYKNGISNGAEDARLSTLEQDFKQFSKDNSTAHSEINTKIDAMNSTLNQLVGRVNKNISYCAAPVCPAIIATVFNH